LFLHRIQRPLQVTLTFFRFSPLKCLMSSLSPPRRPQEPVLSPVARTSAGVAEPPAPGSRLRASSRQIAANPPPAAPEGFALLGPDGLNRIASPYGLHDFESDLRECVLSPMLSLNTARCQPRRWGACNNSLQTCAQLQESEDGSPRIQASRTDLDELFAYWNSQLVEHIERTMSKQEGLIREVMKDHGQLFRRANQQTKDGGRVNRQETMDEAAGYFNGSEMANEKKDATSSLKNKRQLDLELPAIEAVEASESKDIRESNSSSVPLTNNSSVPPTPASSTVSKACKTASKTLARGRRSRVPLGEMLRMDLAEKRASQNVHEQLATTPAEYSDGPSSKTAYLFGYPAVIRCVKHKYFERLSCIVSGLNVLMYGIQVQLVSTHELTGSEPWLLAILVSFTAFFFWEFTMRVLAQGRQFMHGKERRWNLLDTVVLVASVFEVLGSLTAGLESLPFRTWQIAKLMRLFRLIRAFKLFRALKLLVLSIMSTVQQLFWTMALIVALLFTFATVFTEATAAYLNKSGLSCSSEQVMTVDFVEEEQLLICTLESLYGDLGLSMLTLSMAMTGGMDWADCYWPLREVGFVLATFFLLFLSFAVLAVMNVVTAIFCQNAIDSAHIQRDEKVLRFQEQQDIFMRDLREIFEPMDTDGDGSLTLREFECGLREKSAQGYLQSMELTIQEARMLFNLLSGGSNTIEIEDFIHGCLQLRGGARNFDLALLRLECQYLCECLHAHEGEGHNRRHVPKQACSAGELEGGAPTGRIEKNASKTTIASLSGWMRGRKTFER